MTIRHVPALVVSIITIVAAGTDRGCRADDLIPAGSINGVFGHDRLLIVVEDDAAVIRHATGIRDQFFAHAEIVKSADAIQRDLSGHNLIVYGTPDGNHWIRKHADRLPIGLGDTGAEVQARRFDGARLRVIGAVRNPDDLERRVVVYMATRPADLVNINAVFHGPTEWVVARGNQPLASGNYVITTPLSRERMEADLQYLVDRIGAVHPAAVDGMPDDVRSFLDHAREQISDAGGPIDRAEFWLMLNRVLVGLHDAHSSMHPLESGETLDLPVRWLRDGIIVTHDSGELRTGDRVVTMGGDDTDMLERKLSSLIPAENLGWVRHRGASALRDLAVLRLLGIARAGTAVIVGVERDGTVHQITLRPTDTPTPTRAPPKPWVRYSIDPKASLGVLTLDQCKPDEHYRSVLDRFFREVADNEVRRIAVDLRRNSGGNSAVTNQFIRHLDVAGYADYSAEVRISPDVSAQRGDQGEPGYRRYGPNRQTNQRIIDPPPFSGDVFVLTSNRSFSSGSWFATVLQDNGLATVIGEPTGSAPSGVGDILTFTLPESGYAFTLSYKKFLRPDPTRDPQPHLAPDREIRFTRRNLIEGTDPVLAFLESLP